MAESLALIRVADAETTALVEPAELVEIGWTDVRLFPTGWAIESGPYSRLVNPGMPITFGAMAAHHISQEEAAGGMDPDEARALLNNGADMICTHNWRFDKPFIRSTTPAICTYKCSKTVWPDIDSHSNGAIRYARKLCIGDQRAYPPHRAGPDTWVTAHILLDLLKERSVEELIEISGLPLILLKIDFGEHAGKPFLEIPWSYLDWIVNKSNMPQDPKREDVVHTAIVEMRNRSKHTAAAAAPAEDPDAWRSEVARLL